MDVVLLMGLAALGYAMAVPKRRRDAPVAGMIKEGAMFGDPDNDEIPIVQAATGHNNMVPFFGANRTQSTFSDGHESLLDKYTGMGKHTFFRKEEASNFFEPEAGRENQRSLNAVSQQSQAFDGLQSLKRGVQLFRENGIRTIGSSNVSHYSTDSFAPRSGVAGWRDVGCV